MYRYVRGVARNLSWSGQLLRPEEPKFDAEDRERKGVLGEAAMSFDSIRFLVFCQSWVLGVIAPSAPPPATPMVYVEK